MSRTPSDRCSTSGRTFWRPWRRHHRHRQNAAVIYVNPRGCACSTHSSSDVLGRPLKELYPDTLLPRLLTTGKPEYNVHLQHVPGSKAALSDRMPIWEDDKIVGAVAIFQDCTEATAMAGGAHRRAIWWRPCGPIPTSSSNKLHIILGMIQLGQVEQAEQYILDISQIHHQSVSRAMSQIEDTAVAALLVGKTSRAGAGHQPAPGSQKHPVRRWPLPPPGCWSPFWATSSKTPPNPWTTPPGSRRRSPFPSGRSRTACSSAWRTPDRASCLSCSLHFEPNVSTKGDGHGIGLSRIRELVNLYHGQIRVESEPKSGTAFFLSFQTPEEERAEEEPSPTSKGERHAGNLSGRDRGGHPMIASIDQNFWAGSRFHLAASFRSQDALPGCCATRRIC